MRLRTLATRMVSRLSVTSNGLAAPSRTIFNFTELPGLPRKGPDPTASAGVSSRPSTAMMVSPERKPARAAGVSSIADTIFTEPSGRVTTSTPMPS